MRLAPGSYLHTVPVPPVGKPGGRLGRFVRAALPGMSCVFFHERHLRARLVDRPETQSGSQPDEGHCAAN